MLAVDLENELAELEKYQALWVAALRLYHQDASAKRPLDNGEARDDLHGNRRILGRLCDRLGLDVDEVARLMLLHPAGRGQTPKREI